MELFTDDTISGLLESSLETAVVDETGWHDVGRGPGSIAGRYIKWHTISHPEQSVVEDVLRIRSHPLVPKTIPVYGYIYDVRTGRLIEVPQATAVGRAPEQDDFIPRRVADTEIDIETSG